MSLSNFMKTINLVYIMFVSILVIVDVSLKYICGIDYSKCRLCFNPCYSGCLSQIGYVSNRRCSNSRVSILVIVDVSLK